RAAVVGTERLEEAGGGVVHDVELVAHAGAGVDQHDQIERDAGRLEELDALLDAVFVDDEVVRLQADDEFVAAVLDGDVERDEGGAAMERRAPSRPLLRAPLRDDEGGPKAYDSGE